MHMRKDTSVIRATENGVGLGTRLYTECTVMTT